MHGGGEGWMQDDFKLNFRWKCYANIFMEIVLKQKSIKMRRYMSIKIARSGKLR